MHSRARPAPRKREALCGIEVAVHRAAVFITGRIVCASGTDPG
jgi:hypothetical protein